MLVIGHIILKSIGPRLKVSNAGSYSRVEDTYYSYTSTTED